MNGVLVAIALALVLIFGIGYAISRMGASPKPQKPDEREWFV